ncbi:ABC transporter permease [Ornithinibacillus scapharcae]|uniref:ABC transporter permease n=1 Tax=Ornithinibacillus scapharcae TaxID=1147159 RepID=UPI000225B62A|nr:ABC transporter permease [Ornithinibacillus scapharcae]
MVKLIWLEWKKLKRQTVISEIIIYMLIIMIMPVFFINAVMPAFGESYASAIELNFYIQMGFVLFGGSLINQVFIEEYKNKTMALSFGYPISRKKLYLAKILFIALCIFVVTVISYIFTGIVTYTIDQFFPFINGQPTSSDILTYFGSIFLNSLIVTLISFVPLFFLEFG